ncbi:MAG TPA: dihydrofolate reductase family protein [Ktedonobacterales bacterium]|nr:dihydrofolate reductase family protein [Ktedonobacterales bacterium]
MRKVFLNMTMTLDGFFCGPNGELDWMSQTPDQELNDDIVAFFQGMDDGFIGYPTASGMIPYWLHVAQNPSASKEEHAIAQAVNKLHAFILSNREETLPWEHTELLVVKSDDDLVAVVNKIKQQPGRDLDLPGGIRTAQTFMRLGLIDEFVLAIHPVTISKGQSVFMSRVNLELISVKTYQSGVMRVHYRPSARS